MAMTLADVTARLRTPQGRKLLKYSAASVVSVIVSVVALLFFDGVLRWGAVVSSTLATGIATIPSYELNRKWAWGKHGKSHLWREVVPFWVLAFVGWGFSTYSVKLTEQALRSSALPHYAKAGLDAVVYIAAFGILWIAKFVIFNRLLFTDHHARTAEAAGVDGMAA